MGYEQQEGKCIFLEMMQIVEFRKRSRGRYFNALNGGLVRVHQLGGDVAGIDGGGGVIVSAKYLIKV